MPTAACGPIREALDEVQVQETTATVEGSDPSELNRLVPWNTPEKHEAYAAVQRAARKVRKAEAKVASARTEKDRQRASTSLARAHGELDGATEGLRRFVRGQAPRIERTTGRSRSEVEHEIDRMALGLRNVKRTRYDFDVDGEHVILGDHVDSYATTTASGVDGGAARDGRTGVEHALRESGQSASVQKIIGAISSSEGTFSTVNTYDKATLTWGMLQWTGGHDSDLVSALASIKRSAPDAFSTRFGRYGIDVDGGDLVITGPDGKVKRGADAAREIQARPELTAVMARAGMDPRIQKGEIVAARQSKIDAPLAQTLRVKHGKKTMKIRLGDVFTSEYGVGVVADATVHGGLPKRRIEKALTKFLGEGKSEPGDVASWSPAAEKYLLRTVVNGWTKRAAELDRAGCSRAPGSFRR